LAYTNDDKTVAEFAGFYVPGTIHVEITAMWDDKSSVLVEGTRRYLAFVYLCETAHRHVAEGSNFIDF